MTNINTFQGDVFIHEYIKHTGDDNNLFGFSGTDTFKIATAGADRLTINSGGSVTVGVNMFIPDYIHHVGDSDALFGFSGTDTFKIATAGVDRLTVNSAGNVDIGVNLVIPDYIYHTGDTNTYFGFSGADTIVMRTAGSDRLTVQSNGNVGIGTATSDNRVHIYNNVDNVGYVMENNARTFTMGIRGDTSDVFAITDDTAGAFRMTVTTAGVVKFFGDVYFNQNFGLGAVSGSYGSVETKGTGAGSYEGYNINGQWVFMSNGAGSCGIYNDTNNEWMTQWIQNSSTDLYYNGSNKFQTTNDGAHVSGALYADHMYIDDYIYHNGDTNCYLGFSANDTFKIRTGGTDRVTVSNTGRVTLPNDLLVAYNVNRTSYFGRAAVGYCGHNDSASFCHIDRNSTTEYGILHDANGVTYINTPNTREIRFRSSNGDHAIMRGNTGFFGFGSTSPLAPVDVANSGSGTIDVDDANDGYYMSWNTPGSQFQNQLTGQSISINGDGGNMVAHGFYAGYSIVFLSDRRIKKDIRELVDSEALSKFRLLKPSKYKYIEPLLSGRTHGDVYGFIAQEVAEVLPEGVTIGADKGTNQGHIPNMMSMCTVTKETVDTDTYNAMTIEQRVEYIHELDSEEFSRVTVSINHSIDLTTLTQNNYSASDTTKSISDFEKNADGEYHPVIFYNKQKISRQANITRVINESTFIIDDPLFNDSQMISGNQVLLYGQRPNDFHRLNKDAIFTLSAAALQEVDRQQQADKVRIAALETQLTSVLSRLDALENV